MTAGGNQRKDSDYWYAMVKKWYKGKLNMIQFCKQENIARSTFKGHRYGLIKESSFVNLPAASLTRPHRQRRSVAPVPHVFDRTES